MMSIRAVCISALLITVPAIGQQPNEFTPRTPVPKLTVVAKPLLPTGRLIVKFKDEVQARVRNGQAKSMVGTQMNAVDQLTLAKGLTFKPLFGDVSENRMKLVEMRAAAYSGKVQPDLAGMMYLDGPSDKLDQVVQQLNALNIVEYVEYDQEYETKGGAPEPACGEASGPPCFQDGMGAGPYCNDLECCQRVCSIRPFCCDEDIGDWDNICAEIANLFCDCTPPCVGGPGADRCAAPLIGGSCFDAHPFGGCSSSACCSLVCAIEPFCCVVEWDDMCINIANENCEVDTPGTTPDFSETNIDPALRLQQYRTATASSDFFANFGYSGEGLDVQGLWDFGNLLLDLGIGTENLSNGRTIRVGIVEHSARVHTSIATGHAQNNPGHEDLASVICEPGQTPFPINEGIIHQNHGTACLGIAVGEDNGFGVTGIARHAQGYFFPIVSQEAGGRIQAAMLSAIETFEPGDVLSFSIGPGGCGTLASSQADWNMLRLAADSGITCCLAAGNDCCNLDGGAQAGGADCGCIFVGACVPGATSLAPGAPKFCRLGFSNHCQECEANIDQVHCAAWGTAVCSCGYGDLFSPGGDADRAYTAGFNGTSAACPQIAGYVACLQGLAKQFYGVALAPEQVRATVAGNLLAQCSIQNPANLPGAPAGFECAGDFSFDETPNLIGGFPSATDGAVDIVSRGFFDEAPQVRDITLVKGIHVFGNVFSIKATDNNFYIIDSSRNNGGHSNAPHGEALTYLGKGGTTDVIVGAKVDQANTGTTLNFTGASGFVGNGLAFLVVQYYNWRTGAFDFAGFSLLADGAVTPYNATVPVGKRAGSYINPSTSRVEVRVYTIGLGSGGYTIYHDLINPISLTGAGPNPGFGP